MPRTLGRGILRDFEAENGREKGKERVARRLIAEKAADDAGARATAAMNDAGKAAFLRGKDESAGVRGRDVRSAGQNVRMVLRKEQYLAAPRDDIGTAVDLKQKLALLDIVIGDEGPRDIAEGRAVVRLHARQDAPGSGELCFQKNTARETHRAENIRQRVH